MRICVDATSLLLRSAGVKNYVYHWLRGLKRHAGTHEITAFPFLDQTGALDHERSVLTPLGTYSRIAVLQFVNKVWCGAINHVIGRPDVFHISNQVHGIPHHRKLTATLFDMTAMMLPEFHTVGTVKAETQFYNRVLKRADGMIAISDASKNDAVRLLGIDEKKVAVIYPGIDERFFQAVPIQREKPYVLALGTVEPRKNLDTLLSAWLALPASIHEEYDLVVAGPMGWASPETTARLKQVRYVGYVPEVDLPGLTAGAAAFAYPSLYEGFGFPLAQAMAAGVPCITSNVSSMPEVAGDAALLIDPRSTAELRHALLRLLTEPSLRERLGGAGRERAQRYTWDKCALQSIQFYEKL